MTPLRIEVWVEGKWVTTGEVKPGQPPASFSNIKLGGKREIYVLECKADDSGSTVSRSTGIDVEVGRQRVIFPEKLEEVKELKKDESLEMEIKTEISPAPGKLRLTHY